MTDQDELDEQISSCSAPNPAFPEMVNEALRAREVLRALTQARVDQGRCQTMVAARMGSSQSVVARIERGDRDVRLSTLARYAAAVGRRVNWSVSKAKSWLSNGLFAMGCLPAIGKFVRVCRTKPSPTVETSLCD